MAFFTKANSVKCSVKRREEFRKLSKDYVERFDIWRGNYRWSEYLVITIKFIAHSGTLEIDLAWNHHLTVINYFTVSTAFPRAMTTWKKIPKNCALLAREEAAINQVQSWSRGWKDCWRSELTFGWLAMFFNFKIFFLSFHSKFFFLLFYFLNIQSTEDSAHTIILSAARSMQEMIKACSHLLDARNLPSFSRVRRIPRKISILINLNFKFHSKLEEGLFFEVSIRNSL